MDSIFKGDLNTAQGRAVAWIDSLFVDHAVLRLAHSNFGTVIPGKLYRCNHPTPMLIRRLTRRVGLTTVINLRGATGTGSYHLSPRRRPETGPGLSRPGAGEPRRAASRPHPAAAGYLPRVARPGAAALQVGRGPRRAGGRTVPAVRGRLGATRRCGNSPGATGTSNRRAPASWMRSSCATSARARAANRSLTGSIRITTRPRCAAISTPTGWRVSSTTGCWCTSSGGCGSGDPERTARRWRHAPAPRGKSSAATRPGRLSLSVRVPPCSLATASTTLRPSPMPSAPDPRRPR